MCINIELCGTSETDRLLHVSYISLKQNKKGAGGEMVVFIDCFFQSHCYFNPPPGYCLLSVLILLFLWLSDIQHCVWTWCKTFVCSKYVPHVKMVLALEGAVNNDKGWKAYGVVEFIVLCDLWDGMHIFKSFQKYLAISLLRLSVFSPVYWTF